MTDEILTSTERLRFDELPTSLSENDIVRYFTLSKIEIEEAKKCRGAENQIGFALQLCTLRMIGGFPTDTKQVPREVISFLASQASPNAILTLIRQIDQIREMGVDKLDFSLLSSNKLKYLAKLGKGYSTSPMLRFSEEKRFCLIACFLRETLTETIDTTLEC